MKAILVHRHGGPEALEYGDAPDPGPGPGQAVIRIEAIGVNFIDVYHRAGLYPIDPPFSPGSEAAGVVTAVGDGVTEVQVGDRVAHAMVRGSYAEMQAVDSWRLVRLPDRVDAREGAAIMLQGMTAHYLCHSTFPLQSGQSALVHAAAGGVGLLLIQMAKRLGPRYTAPCRPKKRPRSLAKPARMKRFVIPNRILKKRFRGSRTEEASTSCTIRSANRRSTRV